MSYRNPAEIPRARLPLLDRLVVKTPCHEDWNAMTGDDRARLCAKCNKTVFDLSAMSQDEAETFLADNLDDENPCVRLYRRPDGTVLTTECARGAKVRHGRRVGAAAAATACALAGVTALAGSVKLPNGHNLPLASRSRVEVPRRTPPVTVQAPFAANMNADMREDHAMVMGLVAAGPEPDPPLAPPGFRPPPVLRQGDIQVNGRLPTPVVSRIIRQNYGRFRLCYENALRHHPDLRGSVVVKLVIGRDGSVVTAQDGGSDLPDQETVSCVVRSFMKVSFPQPDGGIVTVSTRIDFAPKP
jgi:hypothetical protein